MGIYVISGTVENLVIWNSYKYVLCSSDEVKVISKSRSTVFPAKETTNYIYVNDADSDQMLLRILVAKYPDNLSLAGFIK